MLATTLVATHSHSPWSSLPRERICRVPPGSVLCLLLLGFPTLGKEQGERGKKRKKKKKNTTQQHAEQGEEATWLSQLFALGSLLPMRSPQFWERTRHGNARDMRTGAGDHNPDTSGKTPRHPDGHRDLRKNKSPASKAETATAAWGRHTSCPQRTPSKVGACPQEMSQCPFSPPASRREAGLLLAEVSAGGTPGTWEADVHEGAWQLSSRAERMDLVRTRVPAHYLKLCKSHVAPSPLRLFFMRGSH